MTVLEFARSVALPWSVFILITGTLWRLFGIILLKHKTDFSQPRKGVHMQVAGSISAFFKGFVPKKEFWSSTLYTTVLGYVFHIGLAITVFGFGPHMRFVNEYTGLYWPGLPTHLVNLVGVVTIAALVALLLVRLRSPVLRKISNFDDYFSWAVTVLPVLTGIITTGHFFQPYEFWLGVHILTVALLFAYLPFGKLGHTFLVFLSRGTTGYLFARRGVKS